MVSGYLPIGALVCVGALPEAVLLMPTTLGVLALFVNHVWPIVVGTAKRDRPTAVDDHEGVTNLQDVIDAWATTQQAEQQLREAQERYREVVRAAIADGVAQVQIAKALDRTREMIRRDAMTDEQRAGLRRTETARMRQIRSDQGEGEVK
jgi:hypothetical protein